MGLEAVELLLSVEELFEVEFTDAEAAVIETVGQLAQAIVIRQQSQGRQNIDEGIILDQLRTLIGFHLGAKRETISTHSRFRDLYDFL